MKPEEALVEIRSCPVQNLLLTRLQERRTKPSRSWFPLKFLFPLK